MNLAYLKFVSGVEIVGKIVSDDPNEITIQHPLLFTLKERENETYFQLNTYNYFSSDVTFMKRFLFERSDVSPNIAKLYEAVLSKQEEEAPSEAEIELSFLNENLKKLH